MGDGTPPPPKPGDLVEVDPDDCLDLLATSPICRVGFVLDDEQHVLPVAFVLRDGAVCFKSSPGSKLGIAAAGGDVVVQADGTDAADHLGWSVLGRGTASIVIDPDELSVLTDLAFEPWALPADEGMWVRVDVARWSGRRVIRPA